MKRREFFQRVQPAAMALVTVPSGWNRGARYEGISQSERGVKIHPFQSQLMRGFPTPEDQIVTMLSSQESREHLVWAHQHMSELCATQPISRGNRPLTVLSRNIRNMDNVKVSGVTGDKTSLGKVLIETYTDAFLVMRRGKILTEQYFNGMKPESCHHLWSLSKSISVGVLFNLIERGLIDEHEKVTGYLPELASSGYEGATVRQLLDMQSNVEYDYGESTEADGLNVGLSRGEQGRHLRAAGYFPRLDGENPVTGQYDVYQTLRSKSNQTHGSVFHYKCSDSGVLGWICEKVTGQRFADLVSQHIWSKLGAEQSAYIVSDSNGTCTPYSGISVTLRDLARWGQMHLRLGMWNGTQIIPRRFIEDIQQNHDPTKFTEDSWLSPYVLPGTAYRSQFWIPGNKTDAYYADGAYGQYCYIHPESETVIVRFATQSKGLDNPEWLKIMTRVFADLVEVI